MAGEQFLGGDITGDGVNDVDITNAGDYTIINGVQFTDAVRVGSGTGGYNTFLAISNNSGVESGFNSDQTPPIDPTNHDIDQAKTHTVLLSSLVVTTINGVDYYQIRVDLNEANSDPNAQISLDQFKVYTSTSGTVVSTTTLATQNLVYDMDAGGNKSILLSDAGSTGSGTDDYSILIPTSLFAGQDPTTTYMYVYAQLGAAGSDWTATSTFEEFNLENGVALTGVKFNDLNGDGVRQIADGEVGVAGVTIFIDANKNGAYDVGERTTVTDANGNYTFYGVPLNQTVWIDEVTPAGATQTTGAHETVVIASNATGTITVDPIGNHYPVPSITIDKSASVPGDCADTVGEDVTYTVTVTNNGEVALEHVVLNDSFEGGSDVVIGSPSGDVGNDGILSVGETWTYTYTHEVTQDDIDSNGGDGDGTLDNVATVTSDPVGSSTTNVTASDDASADVCQNPAVTIDKTAVLHDGGDCADQVGDVIDYTVTVTNTGNVTLENVVVTDSFEGGSDVIISGPNDDDGNGVLDVGETWTYTYSHTVTQDDLDSNGGDNDGTLDNVATVNADAVTSGEAAPEASDDASADVCQFPTLSIDKTAVLHDGGDCADQVGDVIDYTVVVTNTGNVTLDNVVVTDSFEGGSDVIISGPNDDDGNGVLDVGESWTYTYSHTVTQEDLDSNGGDNDGTLDNVATANATAVTSGAAADPVSDDASADVCQFPTLSIDKTAVLHDGGDCADQAGDVIDYTVVVTNTGNVTLDNVVVTDSFEGGSDVIISGPNDDDGNGVLDVGESWTYTYSHTVTQDEIDTNGVDGDGTLDNIATANATAVTTGAAADPVSDDASADVCQFPTLSIDKTAVLRDGGDCADQVGDFVDYTVTVTNTGNVAVENVVVTDSFEGGSDVIISGPNDDDGDGILSVGETWTYTYSHEVTQDDLDSNGGDNDGTLDNVATANGTAVGTGLAADAVSDDASADVCQFPTLSIDKTAVLHDGGDCADQVGDVIDYTVTVTNTGNVTLENVVVTDSFEGGSDVIISGPNDDDGNGVLDVGETWTYTYSHTVTQDDLDSNGGDNDGTLDNVATANATAVSSGAAADPVSDDASADVCQFPTLSIDKTAVLHDGGDCADQAGDVIDYTVTVTNTGNVTLDNVVVTDSFEGGSDVIISGPNDDDGDGVLSVGETWTYTYSHTVTQEEMDSNGVDGDGTLDNIATANATAVTSGAAADAVSDDASADVCQFPTIDITKYVDVGAGWDDANSAPGPQDLAIGDPVDFKVTLTNTGNVTLTDVDLTDQNNSNGTTGTPNLLIDNGVLTQYAIDHGAVLTEDDTTDGVLQVGETWTITYTEAFDAGQHENTAAATTAEGASDQDDANYFSVNLGPCPRTPGFWQNMKNGGAFWDGVAGNEKHAGEHDFPDGELLYAVDSNNDGVIDGNDQAGLLIGDWDKDGLTGAGEDTLFVSYADARSLINASNKQLSNGGGDGKFMLGRDMVAAWLNYEMGSGFGDASDPASPTSYLQDAINFMQIYSGAAGGTGILDETFDKFVLSGAIKSSSSLWKTVQPGVDHSGAQLHGALDYYNNTGMTSPDGIVYAQCDDDVTTATATMPALTSVKAAPLTVPSSLQHPMMGMVGLHDFTTHLGAITQHTPDIV